jgi:predicted nucleotidyltransferase
VPKPVIFRETEARFLRELNRRKVRFLIVGLSAANLQGAAVVTADIDLWFENLSDPGIRAALKTVGGFYVPPTALTPPQIGGDQLELFDLVLHANGLDAFAQEYRRTKWMDVGSVRVKVLPLERIIVSKRAANRPKDRLVLPVLEDVATTLAARRRRKTRR